MDIFGFEINILFINFSNFYKKQNLFFYKKNYPLDIYV